MIHILIMLVILLIVIKIGKTDKPMSAWGDGDWKTAIGLSLFYPFGICYIIIFGASWIIITIIDWYDAVNWTKERSWRKK